jgi:hypothetical protein
MRADPFDRQQARYNVPDYFVAFSHERHDRYPGLSRCRSFGRLLRFRRDLHSHFLDQLA